MELFLASIHVTKSHYRGSSSKFTVTQLVRAEDEHSAQVKAEKHWEDKTSEYSVYYHANATILETIE
jgi:hypothetical protein